MSNLDNDLDFDGTDESQNGGGPADLRKALKAAQKERKEALDELASLRAEKRSQTVSQILQAKGVKAAVAKFIPDDVKDADGVTAWLVENGELFGVNVKTDSEPQGQEPSDGGDAEASQNTVVPAELQELWQRMQQNERSGESALPPAKAVATLDALKNAGSFDAAAKILANGGV